MKWYEKRGFFRAVTPRPQTIDKTADGHIFTFPDGSRVIDRIERKTPAITEVTRSWEIRGKGRYRLFFEWNAESKFKDWFFPSVLYRENRDGAGNFPRGGIDSGLEFREDRMGIPGALFLLSDDATVGIFTEPAREIEHISSTGARFENERSILSITIPLAERPRPYIAKGFFKIAYGRKKTLYLKSRGSLSVTRTFFIYRDSSLDYHHVFRFAADRFGKPTPEISRRDLDEQIDIRRRHISSTLYYEKDGIAGIRRGINPNPIIERMYYDIIGGGFLDKGVEAAYLLFRLGERDKAKKIADFLLGGQMENGLAWNCYHLRKKKWGGAFLASPKHINDTIPLRPLGEMGYYYIKLFSATGDPLYLKYAQKACDFFLGHQMENGNYGRLLSPDGRVLDDRGTNGAYVALMMLEYSRAVSDDRYKNSALRAVEYFIDCVIVRGEFLGDALDSDCIDKEGGAIILKLLIAAHGATGDRRYLDAAARVADYILTWTWSYDVAFDEKSLLSREGFSSFGGTSVSVAHHHLDFFGVDIAVDLLKLDMALREDRYRFIALPMIRFGFQLLNGFRGRKNIQSPEITGWQPEQIDHTDWDYMHPLITGGKGAYHFLDAWTPVLVLGALMEFRDLVDEGKIDYSGASSG